MAPTHLECRRLQRNRKRWTVLLAGLQFHLVLRTDYPIASHSIHQSRALLRPHVTIIQPLAHWRSSDGGSRVTTVSHNPGDLPDLDSHDPSPRGLDTGPAEHSYSVKCFSLCPQFWTSASSPKPLPRAVHTEWPLATYDYTLRSTFPCPQHDPAPSLEASPLRPARQADKQLRVCD